MKTMEIDVALNPAEIARLPERDLSQMVCVVFDILRATSSMVTAFANGAAAVYPVRTIDEAVALKKTLPDAILGGERHGDRIEGFDVGNSPFEYRELEGRTIISTTTNGTIALRACEQARETIVGALLNLDAVIQHVRSIRPSAVLLVCAGTFDDFALEDAYAAGLFIQAFPDAEWTDSARTVALMVERFSDPFAALSVAKNGRVLIGRNRQAEVEWCATLSQYKVIPVMKEAVIRPLPMP